MYGPRLRIRPSVYNPQYLSFRPNATTADTAPAMVDNRTTAMPKNSGLKSHDPGLPPRMTSNHAKTKAPRGPATEARPKTGGTFSGESESFMAPNRSRVAPC